MTRNTLLRLLISLFAVGVCISLLSPAAAHAQSDGTKKAESEPTEKPDAPERRVVKIIGDVKLDVRQWPLLGKPDAKYVFVEMFDYTCPHCRDMHHEIDKAFEKYGDDLAIITLAVPLSTDCNNQIGRTEPHHREACKLANLAITVWKLKPDKYREYHDWLFESDRARSATDARQQAVKIVGEEKLEMALAKEVPQKFVASHIKLYAKAGRGSIPKVLFPNVTLTGNVGSERLCATIERELGQE